MNTPLSWIKAYVDDLDCTDQEYMDAMTLSGTKVEGFERLDADLDKIVVGKIEKIEKHPDADKLVVCQVNVGKETVQIVTGAQIHRAGHSQVDIIDPGNSQNGNCSKDQGDHGRTVSLDFGLVTNLRFKMNIGKRCQ